MKLVNIAGQIFALLFLLASALHACCASHQARAASLLSVPVHNQGHLTGPMHAPPNPLQQLCITSLGLAQEESFWAMLCSQMRPFILVHLLCCPMDSALTSCCKAPDIPRAFLCHCLQFREPTPGTQMLPPRRNPAKRQPVQQPRLVAALIAQKTTAELRCKELTHAAFPAASF